jgi:hypothetical protein
MSADPTPIPNIVRAAKRSNFDRSLIPDIQSFFISKESEVNLHPNQKNDDWFGSRCMVKIDQIELPDFPLLLAPMEDVSDPPFRMVCKEHGADLMYTKFTSSEGLDC